MLCVWSSTDLSDGGRALWLRPPATCRMLDFLQRLMMLSPHQVEHRCHGDATVNSELVCGRNLEKKIKFKELCSL